MLLLKNEASLSSACICKYWLVCTIKTTLNAEKTISMSFTMGQSHKWLVSVSLFPHLLVFHHRHPQRRLLELFPVVSLRSCDEKIIISDFWSKSTCLWNFYALRAEMAKLWAPKHGKLGKLWFCSFLSDSSAWRYCQTCAEALLHCALSDIGDLDWE